MEIKEKHAYLIIAHNHFHTLEVLLRMLDDERNDIFLHIDKKAPKISEERLRSCVNHSRLIFTKRISVYWGHSSQVDCEMVLLKRCVREGQYAFVHLISGNDLPIQTQDTIHAFFDAHPNTQFLQVGNDEIHRYRLSRFHFGLKRHSKIREIAADFLNTRCRVDRLKKYHGMPLAKTANWFSITGECAAYIVSKKRFIRRLTRYTACADEMFLGTVIKNSPYWQQVYKKEESWDGHMRYIDRIHNEGTSPHTLTMADKDILLSSDMLWARKFDEDKDKQIIALIEKTYNAC